jgi:hypothetical protein
MQALEYHRQTHIDMMAMLQGVGSNLENYMAKEKRPQYGNVKAHYRASSFTRSFLLIKE